MGGHIVTDQVPSWCSNDWSKEHYDFDDQHCHQNNSWKFVSLPKFFCPTAGFRCFITVKENVIKSVMFFWMWTKIMGKDNSILVSHYAIFLARKFKYMIMRQEAVSLSKCWPLFVEHLQTAVFQRLKLKLFKNDMCKLILHFDLATYELKSF